MTSTQPKLTCASSSSSRHVTSLPASVSVTWQVLAPLGPAVSHHVGVIVANYFYIHGGIDKKGSTTPLNGLHRLDISGGGELWEVVRSAGSPALSHHAAVVLEDRYLLLVGGWNGQKRCADVSVFDTIDENWICMKTSGFPVGGGLSSHTVTLLTDNSMLVIGREGSLRIQTRNGNAYLLHGSITSRSYVYSECPQDVASRSGHSSHGVGKNLFIYGGRSDNLIEAHGNVNPVTTSCALIKELITITGRMNVMRKVPSSRKHHAAVCSNRAIVMHGGETFDGRSREPVGDTYLLLLVPAVQWYHLDKGSSLGRAAHVMVSRGSTVIFHGGEGSRGCVRGETYALNLAGVKS